MVNSYSALGRWFEYLNDDCGYEQWSQYLIELLKNRSTGSRGIDIGCGNGYFTRALVKAGYSTVGIDVSPEMLDKAQSISLKEGIRAEFLLGDITKLKINGKVDFAVAINDCINYVAKDKLKSAFTHVKNCLVKGGTFIFDISSEYKLREIIGNNMFAEDRDEITYLWFNSLCGDRVTMDLTIFERAQNGFYTRCDERHVQYIYKEEEILSALAQAGFKAEIAGHLGKDKKERINFICTAL